MRFHLKTGLEAVRGLRQVKAARFRFMPDIVESPDLRHPLSSTSILALLTEAEATTRRR